MHFNKNNKNCFFSKVIQNQNIRFFEEHKSQLPLIIENNYPLLKAIVDNMDNGDTVKTTKDYLILMIKKNPEIVGKIIFNDPKSELSKQILKAMKEHSDKNNEEIFVRLPDFKK